MASNLTLEQILSSTNVAELLDQDILDEIGRTCSEGYENDLSSREDWEERQDSYMDLAMQSVEEKSFPWPNAANVKYPLLTTAAVQFSSRAYPALVSGTRIVKGRVTGYDPTGEKRDKAIRIGKHMSYQLLEEMEDWEEDMDKLCTSLPIMGCMFKKTYYNSLKGVNVSEIVYPKNLVVNYWAKNLEEAVRKTHVLELSDNDIFERTISGVYLDVDLQKDALTTDSEINNRIGVEEPASDDPSTPYKILEQHRFYDLDDDGYAEPYVVTFHEGSKKVLRIVARFSEEDVYYTEKQEIYRIKPTEYFTKFSFIPNPDGSFYDIGFGLLIGPINETINTLINQLLDAGTINNLQAGFLSRGIRIKGGNKPFTPGEWKTVNSTGDDLRKGIVPLPTKEPSQVLFSLLSLMIEGGQKLSSVTDILTGENPGQNQPATTTMAVIEQGLKVFASIYKRMHRSLKKEFKKLYVLNTNYLPPESYFSVLDIGEGEEGAEAIFNNDYNRDMTDVQPQADPNVASESQRLVKAQALMELLQLGTVNPAVVTKRILEAQEQSGIEELMQMPPQQPNPEFVLEQTKAQDESERDWQRIEIEAQLAGVKLKDVMVKGVKTENDIKKEDREQEEKMKQKREKVNKPTAG